jgi:hypothetical protein
MRLCLTFCLIGTTIAPASAAHANTWFCQSPLQLADERTDAPFSTVSFALDLADPETFVATGRHILGDRSSDFVVRGRHTRIEDQIALIGITRHDGIDDPFEVRAISERLEPTMMLLAFTGPWEDTLPVRCLTHDLR